MFQWSFKLHLEEWITSFSKHEEFILIHLQNKRIFSVGRWLSHQHWKCFTKILHLCEEKKEFSVENMFSIQLPLIKLSTHNHVSYTHMINSRITRITRILTLKSSAPKRINISINHWDHYSCMVHTSNNDSEADAYVKEVTTYSSEDYSGRTDPSLTSTYMNIRFLCYQ